MSTPSPLYSLCGVSHLGVARHADSFVAGVVKWADSIGAGYILSRLRSWQARFPESGGLFAPCEYLEACASKGVKMGGARQKAAKL